MATTLRIDSFHESNIVERTELTADVAVGATTITVRSNQGFVSGQTIYLGALGRDGIESAVVASISGGMSITLTSAATLPHARYDAVTAVVGPSIHVYSAANIDGTVPPDANFSVLATISLVSDLMSTYYKDSAGSSATWYRFTYYNATTLAESPLTAIDAVRGQDYPHYASIGDVRQAAGFQNAYNLPDRTVDIWRRQAEMEINSALSGTYKTPFNPAPEEVKILAIELSAALLLNNSFSDGSYKQGTAEGLIDTLPVRI